MFGNKQEKQARLERIIAVLRAEGEMSIARLAQRIGVPPKTIYDDLQVLHNKGILLQEYKGKVSLYQAY